MRWCFWLYVRKATSARASATLPARPAMDPAMLCQMAAAAANRMATASTVLGPPNWFSRGTSSRQPPAAPRRSQKYTRLTRVMVSEMASETIAPAPKKGSAVVK